MVEYALHSYCTIYFVCAVNKEKQKKHFVKLFERTVLSPVGVANGHFSVWLIAVSSSQDIFFINIASSLALLLLPQILPAHACNQPTAVVVDWKTTTKSIRQVVLLVIGIILIQSLLIAPTDSFFTTRKLVLVALVVAVRQQQHAAAASARAAVAEHAGPLGKPGWNTDSQYVRARLRHHFHLHSAGSEGPNSPDASSTTTVPLAGRPLTRLASGSCSTSVSASSSNEFATVMVYCSMSARNVGAGRHHRQARRRQVRFALRDSAVRVSCVSSAPPLPPTAMRTVVVPPYGAVPLAAGRVEHHRATAQGAGHPAGEGDDVTAHSSLSSVARLQSTSVARQQSTSAPVTAGIPLDAPVHRALGM